MTLTELNKLFREFNKYKYITKNKYTQHISNKYNISYATLVRWRREGLEVTLQKCFGYCKVCDKFFRKKQSGQILCGNKLCLRTHNILKQHERGDNVGRKKPLSVRAIAKKNAKRRVSRKKATKKYTRYTKEEHKIAMSKAPIWNIAVKLGRSVSAIEGHRCYTKRKLLK